MVSSREELLKSKEYWLALIQNQLFDHIDKYMESEGLNRTSLAEKLGVTKGYISQVLNGDFDHRLSKYVEILLATNKIPMIELDDLDKFIKKDSIKLSIGSEISFADSKIEQQLTEWQVYSSGTGSNKFVPITHAVSVPSVNTSEVKEAI